MMKRRVILMGIIGLLVIAIAGVVVWRYTAPVKVRIEAILHDDLPFEAETIPSVVLARPGEMVKVIYRIRNKTLSPLEAFGTVEIAPASATDQIQVFLSQCGGLNAFQSNFPSDYEVVFRVQPAGLFGSSQLALRHVFDRATPR